MKDCQQEIAKEKEYVEGSYRQMFENLDDKYRKIFALIFVLNEIIVTCIYGCDVELISMIILISTSSLIFCLKNSGIIDKDNELLLIFGSIFMLFQSICTQQVEILAFNLIIYDILSKQLIDDTSLMQKFFQKIFVYIIIFMLYFYQMKFQLIYITIGLNTLILDVYMILLETSNMIQILNSLNQFKILVCKMLPQKNFLLKQENGEIKIQSSNIQNTAKYEDVQNYFAKYSTILVNDESFLQNITDINDLIQKLFNNKEKRSVYLYLNAKKLSKDNQKQKKYRILFFKFIEKQKIKLLIRFEEIGIEKHKIIKKFKDIVVASFNHDVKNPIISNLVIIKKLKKEKQQSQSKQLYYLDKLDFNMKFCMKAIEGYLDYSQVQMENLQLNIQKFDLQQEISNTISFVNFKARSKNIRFEQLGFLKEIICKNDMRRITQVLSNFLMNAIKFSKQDGKITVITKKFSNSNLIRIDVKDFGVGMSEQIQNDIRLLGVKQNLKNKSLGIGLELSKEIVKKIGPCQNFFFNSQVEQGSHFWFYFYINAKKQINNYIRNQFDNWDNEQIIQYLQLENIEGFRKLSTDSKNGQSIQNYINLRNENNFFFSKDSNSSISDIESQIQLSSSNLTFNQIDQELPKELPKQYINNYINQDNIIEKNNQSIDKHQTNKFNILIVDDDETIRQILVDFIEKLQSPFINIYLAQDGVEGLEIIQQNNNIDMIFSDIHMPNLNGYDMIKQIKQLKNHQKPDIYVLSSSQSTEHFQICQDLGVIRVVNKPMKYTLFKEIIQKNKNYQNIQKYCQEMIKK